MREGGCTRGETPEQPETLDVAAGCNKPASRGAVKTVERLRKPEDGP
jgi:hypothetical protein